MIPILYRGHIFSFCKDPDEVGLVVETAFAIEWRMLRNFVAVWNPCIESNSNCLIGVNNLLFKI